MRQTISGVVAAIAVMTAGAPAMACGFTACAPCNPCEQVYTPPVVQYGCNPCGGAAYERLAEPDTQYYYVNQGPTYTGPGAFAPYPAYQEEAVPSWGAYRHHPRYYGYTGEAAPEAYGYRWHHHYHVWHHSYRYGYTPHHYGMRYGYEPYHYGHRVLRRYY